MNDELFDLVALEKPELASEMPLTSSIHSESLEAAAQAFKALSPDDQIAALLDPEEDEGFPPKPPHPDYITEVFGENGVFAAHFPGYEPRSGQVELARAIDRAMHEENHALAEGPCGTGKSVAYLVPAIWHAVHEKKRVCVVTANIALQEQLVSKDLPTLAKVLPWGEFKYALLKGRNNFLCLDKVQDSESQGSFGNGLVARSLDDESRAQVAKILEWAGRTQTWDVAELPFIPNHRAWSLFSAASGDCKGKECSHYDDCVYERRKGEAQQADIVVTNYHMLFAHLAVRKATGMDLVLPHFDMVVMDEAHEAAAIARDFFGLSLSDYTFSRIAATASNFEFKDLAKKLHVAKDLMFRAMQGIPNGLRLKVPDFVDTTEVVDILKQMQERTTLFLEDDSISTKIKNQILKLQRATTTARLELVEIVGQTDDNKVYWVEVENGKIRLKGKPINVADIMRDQLFDTCASVSMVSATLAIGTSFDFVKKETGVPPGAFETVVQSPFDFQKQALFVIPDGMPEPHSSEYEDKSVAVFRQVIAACNGRTLGLFTSYKSLNALYARICTSKYRVMKQGDMPRADLTRAFKEDISSVLLGTNSFWTGIDVPGEALTALVIDKLPFPHPEDPIIAAISEKDPYAFFNYLTPLAIMTFRQGVGRLIRSKTDIGVIVVLDARLLTKKYGKQFIDSIPAMRMTRNVSDVQSFMDGSR